MSSLLLNESDKDVIKSISKKHSRGLETWGADSIGGKGEGQIILLHGGLGQGELEAEQWLMGLHRTTWYWKNIYSRLVD